MTFQKGHRRNVGNTYAKGMRHTDEWKRQARLRMLGNTRGFVNGKTSPRKGIKATKPVWNKGMKFPERSGENHPLWIKDRTEVVEKRRLRSSVEWKQWRNKVFERDDFTCQDCGKHGCFLEPHHIIPIRVSKERIFDVSNGIALCRSCHMKTRWKEESLIERYASIVNTKLS